MRTNLRFLDTPVALKFSHFSRDATYQLIFSCNNFCSQLSLLIFVINLSLRFISRFGRFHEDFTLRAFHSLYPFPISIPFTSLSHSPLYPFPLSIPFNSLSFSPLYPFHLSLSYFYLPLYISPSTFLSLSLPYIILLGVSNGRFRTCYLIKPKKCSNNAFKII